MPTPKRKNKKGVKREAILGAKERGVLLSAPLHAYSGTSLASEASTV